MAKTASRQSSTSASVSNSASASETSLSEELSYSEAQTALELALAQLQSSDLPVERMGELYRRARCYADRCEELLNQVEQSINIWDPEQPQTPPTPLES